MSTATNTNDIETCLNCQTCLGSCGHALFKYKAIELRDLLLNLSKFLEKVKEQGKLLEGQYPFASNTEWNDTKCDTGSLDFFFFI